MSTLEKPAAGRELVEARAAQFMDTSVLIPRGWARGLYRMAQPGVESIFGFGELRGLYRELVEFPISATELAERILRRLDVEVDLPEEDRVRLQAAPRPLVVAANHPFGGIDFFALAIAFEALWPGQWKFLSNEILGAVPGFEEKLIALDPLKTGPENWRQNRSGLMAAIRHLEGGGVLGLFPAGRVSHRHISLGGTVADRPWTPHLAKLATMCNAGVACLFIPGRNSRRFLNIPPGWARLRALMLCREFTRPSVSTVNLRLAGIFEGPEVKRMGEAEETADKLRACCYARADLENMPGRPADVSPSRSSEAVPLKGKVNSEVELLRNGRGMVAQSGGFSLLYFRGDEQPATLEALARIREATFQAAGQGTGREVDLNPEDSYYHHLLLWDHEHGRIAGAYRLGSVNKVIAHQGIEGLYLCKVFQIAPAFFGKTGRSLELSRSFVAPAYQRDRGALAALWKGLGAVVRREEIETLFGSVTISNAYEPASRAILVEYLRENCSDKSEMRTLVRARKPFVPGTRYHRLVAEAFAGESIEKLNPLIERLEGGNRGVPVLMRYYHRLGARYLDFHVERAFKDAIYCFLRVDVGSIPEGYRRRFMEKG